MPPKRKKAMKNQGGRRKKIKEEYTVVKTEPESPPNAKENSNLVKRIRVAKGLEKLVKKKNTISCKECNKKFRFNKSYLSHVELEHSKLPGSVGCEQCPVRCPNKKALQQHITNVHEREIFECPDCKKQFVRHTHVLRHMSQKGCAGNEVNIYPCEICDAQFTRKDNLMVHLRLQHITRKKFKCKECFYHTGTFSKLIIHVQKKHTNSPPQYECDHCGKVTSSRAAICKHLEIHGDRKYACDVCGYRTHTVEVMRRHVLTHVSNKPYKCDRCIQSFIQRAQLHKHLEKHNEFVCKECNTKVDNKQLLEAHLQQHEDPNYLMCPADDCEDRGKKFPNKHALKMHCQEKHTMYPRPFVCEVCNKRFRVESDMRRHVLSHTLERARRCMYCVTARAYVRGVQLVKHVRKAHPSVFKEHLVHVRSVLNMPISTERVRKSELESILNVLDAEAERILQGYGEGVLYGGMQETDDGMLEFEVPLDKTTQNSAQVATGPRNSVAQTESSPLMSEEELAENLNKLLVQLIEKELLECFGWPTATVDTVLGKVIEHCGQKPANSEKWSRVQCLRENAKHLFLYVIEDKNIARMLDSHTIDQIVKHILTQVTESNATEQVQQLEE